jgi:dTDP-4-amino-4,6-dideoxygalactose transaminase
MIPQASPRARINRFRPAIEMAVSRVLSGAEYILGSEVEAFEIEFSSYIGTDFCVGVNSGTDAIALALRGLGVGAGDEVITTALTAAATGIGILQSGATPVFVDVDPCTWCIDPSAVAAAVTAKTVGILPVHLFGYPCDLEPIAALAQRHHLWLVEDCAHAHGGQHEGKKLGSFGDASTFSFYPTKNLGCVGDGGAVLTNDTELAARIRRLRNYGFDGADRISIHAGVNSRLDVVQAAILRVLLPHLDEGNAERRAIAAQYFQFISSANAELPPDGAGTVFHQFAIAHPDRDGLKQHLARANISTNVHYAPPLYKHPAFAAFQCSPLANTENLSRRLLSLPVQPEVVENSALYIADAVNSYDQA